MPRPFVIQVQVPLINHAKPGSAAAKMDAAYLVGRALHHFLSSDDPVTAEKRSLFFDDGLDLGNGEVAVKDPETGEYKPAEWYT